MSILIFGNQGFLGSTIELLLKKTVPNKQLIAIGKNIDITNYKELYSLFNKIQPEFCINAVAISNPDICQYDPQRSYETNVIGALNIAKISKIFNCYLISFSTDYIFDGTKKYPYLEEDNANPLQLYGRTKMICENLNNDCSAIIRLPYLYGFSSIKPSSGFVFNIIKMMLEENEIYLCNQQIRHFTFIEDVAILISNIIINPIPYGIYNFSNPTAYTKYQAATIIREIFRNKCCKNLALVTIEKKITSQIIQKPLQCTLSNQKLQNLFNLKITDLLQGIELSIQNIVNHGYFI